MIPQEIRDLGDVEIVNFESYGCGIYFLIKNGSTIYIGKTKRLLGRLEEHYRQGKNFDSVAFMPCEEDDLELIESLAIHFLRPPQNGNRMHTKQKHAPLTLKSIIESVRAA